MSQVTVISGADRRRRWSLGEQQQILATAFAPGVVVADVARQFDVATSLIYKWRRQAVSSKADVGFTPVVLVADANPAAMKQEASVTVELPAGVRVTIHASASSALVATVLRALR